MTDKIVNSLYFSWSNLSGMCYILVGNMYFASNKPKTVSKTIDLRTLVDTNKVPEDAKIVEYRAYYTNFNGLGSITNLRLRVDMLSSGGGFTTGVNNTIVVMPNSDFNRHIVKQPMQFTVSIGNITNGGKAVNIDLCIRYWYSHNIE